MEIQITSKQKELLRAYKTEAFAQLSDIQTAKDNLKGIVEAASDGSGLDKKIVNKFFNMAFKESIKDEFKIMEVVAFLNEKE